MTKAPTPTEKWKPAPYITIELFGAPTDWRTPKNHSRLLDYVCRNDSTRNVTNVFRPDLSIPTGLVVLANELKFAKANLHKSSGRKARILNLHEGFVAEGVKMNTSSDAFLIFPADCPTIVVHDAGYPMGGIVCAHAGRDSLVESPARKANKKTLMFPYSGGVVRSAVDQFAGHPRENLHLIVVPGIEPEYFRHPWSHKTYGKQNETFITELVKSYGRHVVVGEPNQGCINLAEIIAEQAVSLGIKPEHVTILESGGTYDTRNPSTSRHRWHSHRRACEIGGNPRARNAVFIYRS